MTDIVGRILRRCLGLIGHCCLWILVWFHGGRCVVYCDLDELNVLQSATPDSDASSRRARKVMLSASSMTMPELPLVLAMYMCKIVIARSTSHKR